MAAAGRRLEGVAPGWIALAVAAEAASMGVFARLQQRLLRAGGVDLGLQTMTAITLAANAVTGTLPGGVGWAAAWQFEQLGRRGVERVLRLWMFLVAGGVSSFALFLVVASGVESAGSEGPLAGLRRPVLVLAAIPVLALVLEVGLHTTSGHRLGDRAVTGLDERVPGGRRLHRGVLAVLARIMAVRLGPLGWAEVLGLALLNWLLDCLVIVASMEALGVGVPWAAILAIYGLTQITAALPITPGGIGVVAGSLAALLHAYGVPTAGALSVVLLYRLLSFWILVPLGWAIWAVLEMRTRHQPEHRPATAGSSTGGDPHEPARGD